MVSQRNERSLKPLAERFVSKIQKTSTCWWWTGTKIKGKTSRHLPYGMIGVRLGKSRWAMRYAHRVSYELNVGPIPAGMSIDHLCNNPSCVNPEHLRPLPIAENILRGNGAAARCARTTLCSGVE